MIGRKLRPLGRTIPIKQIVLQEFEFVRNNPEEFKRMQKLAGLDENEKNDPNRMLKLIEMYVDNFYDEGMTAEAALEKIDKLLQGELDDYDKTFMAGEEEEY